MMSTWKGVFPAVTTKMTSDGKIHATAMQSSLDRLIRNGVSHVKLVQYIKLAEHLVYGAPEWTRAPRLPLAGEERAYVIRTVQAAIHALEAQRPAAMNA